MRPVGLEDRLDLLRETRVVDDHADLAPTIELQLAEALAADESARTITHHRPHVQPQIGKLARLHAGQRLLDLADYAYLDSGANAVLENPLQKIVADLLVVDQQLLLRAADERRQQLARGLGADDQAVVDRRIRLAGAVGLEQRARLSDQFPVARHDAEAAALLDVELRVVEPEHMQSVVDEHHLAVIARQVVGRPRHGDPALQQPQLELAKVLLASAIRVRDQRPDHHATRQRR